MVAKRSWWLKLDRAEHHMKEVEDEVSAYSEGHPYRAIRIEQPPREGTIPRFVLKFTAAPDPMLATIIGDVIHNVRSALDHVVVGFAKGSQNRKNASFPVTTDDLWKRVGRRYVVRDAERRKSFHRSIAGLALEARAIVEGAQPYKRVDPEAHVFNIISRLDNADKHKQLTVIASGLESVRYTLTVRDLVQVGMLTGANQFLGGGAEIPVSLRRSMSPPVRDSEVDMKIDGTAVVVLQIRRGLGKGSIIHYPLLPTLRTCIDSTATLLRNMEATTRP